MVAGWARGARVVKAFNTCGYNVMANTEFPAPVTMFYCGDDAQAKQIVSGLAAAIGFEPHDAGGLAQARVLEALALLWVTLALKQGDGPEIAFRLMRRSGG
jgi:8-hydroxy-5-deazaflavin:NADPH oxidoreductase